MTRPVRWVAAVLFALGMMGLPVEVAANTGHEAAVARFATDAFPDTIAGIEAVVDAASPLAEPVLQALNDRRLTFDPTTRRVYFRNAAGALFDAASGASVQDTPARLDTVRINNRIRNILQGALGTLTLISPDPAQRMRAAEAVLRGRDPEALPALASAITRETDPRIRTVMEQARAAIQLRLPDASEAERQAAVAALAARGDQRTLALLRQIRAETQPGALAINLDAAIQRMEARLAVLARVQDLWAGISLGSVLLLAAIGLAITFGVMGVINMAHGEMVMLGAYTTFVVQELIRTHAPHLFDWSLPIAIPLAFLVTALVGIAIERGIIRYLYGRPLETLLATFGVSLVLQQAVRTAFGPTNREVGSPSYMSGAFDFFGLSITYGRLWIVVFAIAIFAGLLITLKATSLGLQMRAVTQNRRMASAMGIRTGFVDAMTFALGSGIAGLAGVALSQIDNVSPNLGQGYLIDSFIVVVFGGVGNLWGTLVGALTLGIANKLLEPVAGAVLGKIIILIAIILFIQKRPRGLFALKGRAIEQ